MGKKSSSSASTNTTNNLDNRVAVQDGIGLSNSTGNAITITNTTTDAGSIAAAFGFGSDTVGKALQTVEMSNATLGAGYDSLIDAASSLFDRGESLIGQTQAAVADAYRTATTDKAGGIDQKTIIVLAVAGAAALAFASRRK